MKVHHEIDATGLSCPLPVVRAKKAMDALEKGQVLEIHATDAGVEKDLPAWAKTLGHEIVDQQKDKGVYIFRIRKGE
ncbi:sulfurtransferase TusA family protein [Marininema halotolerans]|uniref:TusA-related sulfurtransferase n=1 Tax=Marininema halotolerans TaxID=1155944 RepID=A0A1I6RWW1_9BACL|nr:sulfurtransferase TusA family protein [Marininema halotolerans]SFS69179.1 TusA-related sulfurtransferase [Marininema halotolerans]